jgi:flagellar hook assembly protein FlgD
LTWNTGQGVSIKYNDSAPDIGAFEFLDPATVIDGRTGSVHDSNIPDSYSLENFPNPFNPSTVVRYELPEATNVDLVVFDIAGRKVARLDSGYRRAGTHTISWNARDDKGRQIASDIYLLRIQAGTYLKTIKMIYLQ